MLEYGMECVGYNWLDNTSDSFEIVDVRQRLFGWLGADYVRVMRLSDGKVFKAEIDNENSKFMWLSSLSGGFTVRVELR